VSETFGPVTKPPVENSGNTSSSVSLALKSSVPSLRPNSSIPNNSSLLVTSFNPGTNVSPIFTAPVLGLPVTKSKLPATVSLTNPNTG
jgi:hypothetical protein